MVMKNRIPLKIWGACIICATSILGSDPGDEIQKMNDKIIKNQLKQEEIYSNIKAITWGMETQSIPQSLGWEKIKELNESLSRKNLKEQNLTEKLEKIYRHEYGYNLIGVALFSGTDLISNTIKRITDSNTSHVGVILSDINDENKWYCFESTGSATEVIDGIYPHVRLTDWDKVVKDYEGSISYRLCLYKDVERPNPIKIGNFVEEYNHKPYTKNPLILLKALFNMNGRSEKTPNTVFCSELTSIILTYCGVLQQNISRNCLPSDFDSENTNSRISLSYSYEITSEFKEK